MRYVNAYSVGRYYGGPEEGGWYYDAGTPIASVPVGDDASDEQIAAVKAELTSAHGWESRNSRSSVLGGDDFKIYVEEHPAEDFPKTRPYYE